MPCPENWAELVNAPQTEWELQAIRRSVKRGLPFGSEVWLERTASRLHLEQTLRRQGRPQKPRASQETPPQGSWFD